MISNDYYELEDFSTLKKHIQKERQAVRALKKTHWWHQQIQKKTCFYCQNIFEPQELTLDHIVPLARGGRTTKNNIVPSCLSCNQEKKLNTPAEKLLHTFDR